jgi:hypothetical protein
MHLSQFQEHVPCHYVKFHAERTTCMKGFLLSGHDYAQWQALWRGRLFLEVIPA